MCGRSRRSTSWTTAWWSTTRPPGRARPAAVVATGPSVGRSAAAARTVVVVGNPVVGGADVPLPHAHCSWSPSLTRGRSGPDGGVGAVAPVRPVVRTAVQAGRVSIPADTVDAAHRGAQAAVAVDLGVEPGGLERFDPADRCTGEAGSAPDHPAVAVGDGDPCGVGGAGPCTHDVGRDCDHRQSQDETDQPRRGAPHDAAASPTYSAEPASEAMIASTEVPSTRRSAPVRAAGGVRRAPEQPVVQLVDQDPAGFPAREQGLRDGRAAPTEGELRDEGRPTRRSAGPAQARRGRARRRSRRWCSRPCGSTHPTPGAMPAP